MVAVAQRAANNRRASPRVIVTRPTAASADSVSFMTTARMARKAWANTEWVLAANLAADLAAWLRLLTLHDHPDLVRAEPATMRFRLYTVPARLARHARRTSLRLNTDWPWATTLVRAWQRIDDLKLPALA